MTNRDRVEVLDALALRIESTLCWVGPSVPVGHRAEVEAVVRAIRTLRVQVWPALVRGEEGCRIGLLGQVVGRGLSCLLAVRGSLSVGVVGVSEGVADTELEIRVAKRLLDEMLGTTIEDARRGLAAVADRNVESC